MEWKIKKGAVLKSKLILIDTLVLNRLLYVVMGKRLVMLLPQNMVHRCFLLEEYIILQEVAKRKVGLHAK